MTSQDTTKDILPENQAEGQIQSPAQDGAVETHAQEAPECAEKEEEKNEERIEETSASEQQPSQKDGTDGKEQAPAEVAKEKEEREQKDYRKLSAEELISEFGALLEEPVQHINRQVRALKEAFDSFISSKTAENTSDEPEAATEGNNETSSLKERFSSLWETYREKRDKYSAQMAVEQKANLEERLALIDELKDLIEKEENASIKEFHNIQARWRKCGMVPREQSSAVWQTYQHHVERFFDYLKLNREFRDMEFERNLADKNKIIARAEELINEPSIKKAFEELQLLHKMWKEDTGPVASEYRDQIWERFSAATRAIHERRHQFLKTQKETLRANMEAKLASCEKIEALAKEGAASHDGWQKKIAEVESLKEQFRTSGPVPDSRNSEIWERFKEVNRLFNQAKNNYYKELKRSQVSNLAEKQALVERAEEIKDSTEWNQTSAELKSLQAKWKEIGHVPRQKSDELWARFRAACNHFFDNMSENRKSGDASLAANLKAKEEIMAQAEAFKVSDDIDKSLEELKSITAKWRAAGRIPRSAKNLEDKFNSLVDSYFDQLKISKREVSQMRFKDKIDQIVEEGNKAKFYSESDYVRRKIDEITREVQQLKNNIEFFSSGSADNPLVREVNKKIERESAILEQWKEKLAYIRSVKLD